ncbi:MAG: ATP-binding cassette domain-containing protein [Bacteroidota bacterium]|nr:ATP-binding cassette domain-containing protein [Bacteroidota bacterium]
MIQVKAQEIDIQRQQRWLYNNASFSLEGSPMWAVKGRNGSGKSTLLQLLIGYIEPTLGSITWSIDQKEIDRMDISQHISYASPSMELPMHLTLKEFMHMHQTFKPFLVPLDAILDGLSLPPDVHLAKFSTGMLQRVKLAQACYSRSKLVALDEPMSNLDEEGKQWIESVLYGQESLFNDRLLLIASNEEREVAHIKTTLQITEEGLMTA